MFQKNKKNTLLVVIDLELRNSDYNGHILSFMIKDFNEKIKTILYSASDQEELNKYAKYNFDGIFSKNDESFKKMLKKIKEVLV